VSTDLNTTIKKKLRYERLAKPFRARWGYQDREREKISKIMGSPTYHELIAQGSNGANGIRAEEPKGDASSGGEKKKNLSTIIKTTKRLNLAEQAREKLEEKLEKPTKRTHKWACYGVSRDMQGDTGPQED